MTSPSSLTFQLPIPDRKLSPNGRAHWRQKAPLTKAARAAGKAEALRVLDGAPAPKWERATYTVVVFKPRESDDDNMVGSLKAYRDGIADAGIVQNDKRLKFRGLEHVKTNIMPRVEITITKEE